MRAVTIAITQFACGSDAAANLDRAEGLVRGAAAAGANIVVLQELFETVYFCREPDEDHFRLARPAAGYPVVARFAALAKELDIVVPVPFFEKGEDGDCFNSVAVIDAGGRELGIYRKTHIPNGDGYREKFYFRAGTEAPRAWDTKFGRLGVAICWDQWFPEVARLMMLAGAELLIYPSAIGSEPADPGYDSKPAWRHAMQGHAAANVVPVAAANRIGTEGAGPGAITFYGGSFVCDPQGTIAADAGVGEGYSLATFDLDAIARQREN